MERVLKWRSGVLLATGAIMILVWVLIYFSLSTPVAKDNLLAVTFLNVGQGDAILIETFDGVQVLVDGGVGGQVVRELAKVMPAFDRSLDMVIATHFDQDHIGGLVDVLERYKVDYVAVSNNQSVSVVAKTFQQAIANSAAKKHLVKPAEQMMLGASTTLLFLSPPEQAEDLETNTASIVFKLSFGEVDFLFTGDAPLGIEDYLAKVWGKTLESEVLKLGHHGSRTSSGENFLAAVRPQFAVVSAGENNSYGHPHSEVVERVEKTGAEILNTAESGRIRFLSDGKKVWVERER